MIKVQNEIQVFANDRHRGESKGFYAPLPIYVNSSSEAGLVVLVVDGQNYEVRADDLKRAVDNARNTGL